MYFARISNIKMLMTAGIGIIFINLFTNLFNSNTLSNLLYNPIVKIDSIDDLVQVIKDFNVTISSSKQQLTWYLFETLKDPRYEFIFKHLVYNNVPKISEILEGKIIVINYSHTHEYLIKDNKHLDLHLSKDAYFGSPIVILYAKQIKISIKERIDSVIDILFESGLQDF